jgi:hypothetical protein
MRSAVGFILGIVLLAAGPLSALAEQGSAGPPGPATQGVEGRKMDPATFGDRKAHIQKMLEDRSMRLAQEKACVDKATNDEEMMKCRPARPMHEGRAMHYRGDMGGPGSQQPMGSPGGN